MTAREFARRNGIRLRPAAALTQLGARINRYCLDNDVRRSEFAARAGVCLRTLHCLMTGKRKFWDERVIEGVKRAMGDNDQTGGKTGSRASRKLL